MYMMQTQDNQVNWVGDRYRERPEGSLFNSFYTDTHLLLLSVKQGGIKYHFKDFGMTPPGIEPRSSGPLVNTLPTRPMH